MPQLKLRFIRNHISRKNLEILLIQVKENNYMQPLKKKTFYKTTLSTQRIYLQAFIGKTEKSKRQK